MIGAIWGATPAIVVVGSSNTDRIIELERIPRPGETLLGSDLNTAAGGKGANQAVAAARAGALVALVARVGADSMRDRALVGTGSHDAGWLNDGRLTPLLCFIPSLVFDTVLVPCMIDRSA